jgi:hypothetical protein
MSRKRHSDAEQSKLFKETAREIGADEDESAADLLMGRLARTPPDPKPAKKPKADKAGGDS